MDAYSVIWAPDGCVTDAGGRYPYYTTVVIDVGELGDALGIVVTNDPKRRRDLAVACLGDDTDRMAAIVAHSARSARSSLGRDSDTGVLIVMYDSTTGRLGGQLGSAYLAAIYHALPSLLLAMGGQVAMRGCSPMAAMADRTFTFMGLTGADRAADDVVTLESPTVIFDSSNHDNGEHN
jgi:hypothetical protein